MKVYLSFSECEHQGDLDVYAADVAKCGGVISKMYVANDDDDCEEMGHIYFDVYDRAEFFDAFKKTESFGFCQYG